MSERICSIEGCEIHVYGRDLCSMHYMRWWRQAPPEERARRSTRAKKRPDLPMEEIEARYLAGESTPELGKAYSADSKTIWSRLRERGIVLRRPEPDAMKRFESKVDRSDNDGCHIWTAGKQRFGYGQFQDRSSVSSHRNTTTHRWIYEQTFGPIPKGMVIMHKCDNPPCVRIEHLMLGTSADNNADKSNKGREARGETHGMSKISNENVIEMRNIYASGKTTLAVLGRQYGINENTVRSIVNHKTWRHV